MSTSLLYFSVGAALGAVTTLCVVSWIGNKLLKTGKGSYIVEEWEVGRGVIPTRPKGK